MHAGKDSPLQQHSIGGEYPYAVIGTIKEGGKGYYIVNLETNERDVWTYESSYVAHYMARKVAAGDSWWWDPIQWIR